MLNNENKGEGFKTWTFHKVVSKGVSKDRRMDIGGWLQGGPNQGANPGLSPPTSPESLEISPALPATWGHEGRVRPKVRGPEERRNPRSGPWDLLRSPEAETSAAGLQMQSSRAGRTGLTARTRPAERDGRGPPATHKGFKCAGVCLA